MSVSGITIVCSSCFLAQHFYICWLFCINCVQAQFRFYFSFFFLSFNLEYLYYACYVWYIHFKLCIDLPRSCFKCRAMKDFASCTVLEISKLNFVKKKKKKRERGQTALHVSQRQANMNQFKFILTLTFLLTDSLDELFYIIG